MKKAAYFLLYLTVTLSQTINAEPFLFVTSENFQKLTLAEQKVYLKTLTEIVIQLDQDFQYEYQTVSSLPSLPAFLFNQFAMQAQAQQVTPSRQYSVDPREESAKIGKMMDFINGQMRAVQDNPSLISTKERLEDDYFETLKRLYTLSEKSLDAESIKFTKRNIETMKNFWPSLVQIKPDLAKVKGNTFRRLDLTLANIGNKKPKATSKAVSETSLAPKPIAHAGLLCLYAGFVVKQTSCTPNKNLPADYELDPLKKETFRCNSDNEILCNPLLFGMTEKNKPYCTVRSSTATKNCQEVSNNIENHRRLFSIWKNPKNKKTIDQFQKDLQSLCQDENRNNDVKATCKVAVKQFNEKIKTELSIDSNKPAPSQQNPKGQTIR